MVRSFSGCRLRCPLTSVGTVLKHGKVEEPKTVCMPESRRAGATEDKTTQRTHIDAQSIPMTPYHFFDTRGERVPTIISSEETGQRAE